MSDLVVLDPPSYKDSNDQNQTEGMNLTVSLTIDANPDPHTFIWFKDGLELVSTERVMLGASYIKFMPTDLQDSGMYSVSATNTKGTGTISFAVKILRKLIFCTTMCLFTSLLPKIIKLMKAH